MESRLSKSPPTRCRSTPTPSAPWFADLSRARYHPDSGPHMRGNPEQHYDTANSRGHQRLQRDRLDRWNVSGIWKFLRLTPETRPLPAPSPFRSCSVSAETQVLREGLKLLEGEQFRSVKLRRLTDQVRNDFHPRSRLMLAPQTPHSAGSRPHPAARAWPLLRGSLPKASKRQPLRPEASTGAIPAISWADTEIGA